MKITLSTEEIETAVKEVVEKTIKETLEPLLYELRREIKNFSQNKAQEELLKIDEVVKMVSMGKSTIFLKISEGTFPQSYKLGENTVRWKRSEIERYISTLKKTQKF